MFDFNGKSPLLSGGNDLSSQDIEKALETILQQKKQHGDNIQVQQQKPQQRQKSLIDILEEESRSLNEQQAEILSNDSEMLSFNEQLEQYKQYKINRLVMQDLESSDDGKEFIKSMINCIRRVKKDADNQQRAQLAKMAKFESFCKDNPSATYADFINHINDSNGEQGNK